MTIWLKRFVIFVSAGLVYLVGQYLRGPWFANLPFTVCGKGIDAQGFFCDSPYTDLGLSLIALGQALAIAGIILLFANQAAFRKWLKFSLWYVPIAAAFVIWFSPGGFIGLPGAATPDYAHEVWNYGYLYILITLVIVVQSRWRDRKSATPTSISTR